MAGFIPARKTNKCSGGEGFSPAVSLQAGIKPAATIFYEENEEQMYGRDLFPPEKLVAEGFIPSRKSVAEKTKCSNCLICQEAATKFLPS